MVFPVYEARLFPLGDLDVVVVLLSFQHLLKDDQVKLLLRYQAIA